MATFTLTIECDNQAFEEPGRELARILRDVARSVEDLQDGRTLSDRMGGMVFRLRDINGNTVGSWSFDGEG
jgi:hypothetical protein